MPAIKADGYVANGDTGRVAPLTAKLWCTDQVIAAGEWIASYAGDTTSPSGLAGGPQGSFRIADASNADALYNTVGVALESVDHSASATAAGFVEVAISGYVASARLDSASTAPNDDLVVSTTGSGATAGYVTAVGNAATNGAAYRIVGQCLTDGLSNTGDVLVNLHPMFAGFV